LSGRSVTRTGVSSRARARFKSVDTLSGSWVTGVNSTCVTIITVLISKLASSVSLVTRWNNTQVVGLTFRQVLTSNSINIGVNGTRIVIITRWSIDFTNSASWVTFVRSTTVSWSNTNNRLADTSSGWVTE